MTRTSVERSEAVTKATTTCELALAHEHCYALDALKRADWMNVIPLDLVGDLMMVYKLYEEQLGPGFLAPHELLKRQECPTSPVLWTSIAHKCLATLAIRKLLPSYFTNPTQRALMPPANETPNDYLDPGNLNLEILWFALRIYRFVQEDKQEPMCQPRLRPYGSAGNRSGKGLTNMRGNMLEAILGECYKRMT